MDKLAAIRIYDGQNYSDEIPVTALAENIQWDESSTLIDILGSINLTRKGNIQDQIDELNNRINQETYSKPIDGIPKTDLANSVQISLGKADTALQSYTETDPTVPAWAKQPNKPTYTAQEVGALPADSQITVEVDDTLSIQGAAADAKAVGDALDSISTSVQNIWTGRCTDRFPTTTINKTIVLDNPEGFSLVNGVTIAIKYIGNAETVLNPCLNVNETGNIPVIAGDDSSFGNDKYYLRSWGDQGLHFFIYRALGNNPGKWYLTNIDTKMWINLIDDFSILQDANVATAQDLGKVPTVKVIRGGQVAEWQYKDITVDNTLNIQGAPADAKKVGNELVQIKQDLEIQQVRAETVQALKINKPVTNPNGTQGQILQTDGQGGTSWVDGVTDEQIADAVTDWLDDHVAPGGSTIVVDDTLSIQGAAADAKKTGDEISDLKDGLEAIEEEISGGIGVSDAVKIALMDIVNHIYWDDDKGQERIDALEDALYPPANLVKIEATYTQSGVVYDNQTLSDLKSDLVVRAFYDNGTSAIVTNYTLSGELTVGTSTITAIYADKTDTFDVTVTHTTQQYTITNTLTNCTNSNAATVINDGSAYSGTLTADSGYIMDTVSIVMGGTDVTSTAYDSATGAISIASATGNIVITAEAIEDTGWISGVPYDMQDGLIENKYLNNGVETSYNGWSISPYMACKGAFIESDTAFTLAYTGYYDAEKTYLNKVMVRANVLFNLDELDGNFLRVSDATSKVTGANITPYRLPQLADNTNWQTDQYYTTTFEVGSYLDTSTGELKASATSEYSDFMNCFNASTITDNLTQVYRTYCFYDGDKTFISGEDIALADQTVGKQITVPSGARFFRTSKSTDTMGMCFELS